MQKILLVSLALSLTFAASSQAADVQLKKAKRGDANSSVEVEHTEVIAPNLSQLSTEEIRMYQAGPISDGTAVAGGVVGTFVGLGIGHAVLGQYSQKGWIFTVGELGSLAVALGAATSSLTHCSFNNDCNDHVGLTVTAMLAYLGFHIWEIIDVWTLPSRYNGEYRAVKSKAESEDVGKIFVMPLLASSPSEHNNYGLGLGFRF